VVVADRGSVITHGLEEIVVFYELTSAGKYIVKLLEAIATATTTTASQAAS
jgi:hypothetical protein